MAEEVKGSPEEIKRWTIEFLNSDFYKRAVRFFLIEQKEIFEMQAAAHARAGDMQGVFGKQWAKMALDNFELWLASNTQPVEEQTLEPPEYTYEPPRRPMGEEEYESQTELKDGPVYGPEE